MSGSFTGLSLRTRRLLWIVLAVGIGVRVIVAFATGEGLVDHDSLEMVRGVVSAAPLDLYDGLAGEDRWPYPPGYVPAILGAHGVDELTGLGFLHLIRLVPAAADVGVALLVQHLLAVRGVGERARLGAVAAVMLGPVFVGVSSYQAQIDSLAILPALAALVVWERDGAHRALAAGLLIGAGGAVKTVPLVMCLALLPWSRSPREAVTLVASAAAVPMALLAPYLLIDAGDVIDHLRYRGFPGLGGLSLLVQPQAPLLPLAGEGFDGNAAFRFLIDAGGAVVAVALLAAAAFLLRYRPPPLEAAILVWLVLWVFGVNFFIQYLVWGIPFLLVAGATRRGVQLQLLAVPALAISYVEVDTEWAVWLFYTLPLCGIWALAAAMLVARTRACASRPRSSPSVQ